MNRSNCTGPRCHIGSSKKRQCWSAGCASAGCADGADDADDADGVHGMAHCCTPATAAGCECTKTQKRFQQNSLGTTNIDGENIDVYPNPSTGAINITAESTIKTVNVYDVLGNLVMSIDGNGSNKYAFNLGKKSNGIYLVKVSTSNGASTKRIVLNK